MRGVAHSAALRQAALEERQRLAAEKKLSWNQKASGPGSSELTFASRRRVGPTYC
jgi:hypothetical protein